MGISKLIFLIIMILPILISSQIYSVIIYILFAFYFLLSFKRTIFPKIVYPLLFLLPIGLIYMNGHNYDIVKDFAYFLNPIIILTLGFLIANKMNDFNSIIKIIILASLIISFYHLFNLLIIENFVQQNLFYISKTIYP